MPAGLVVVIALLAPAIAVAIYLLDRGQREAPASPAVEPPIDREARAARQRSLEEHQDRLLDRRVELDSRRGALMGDDRIYGEFVALERRFRAGEIDEREFEREKLRLLGGGV